MSTADQCISLCQQAMISDRARVTLYPLIITRGSNQPPEKLQ